MDDDSIGLHPYGTPLDPINEDEIPAKRPVAIEDQIVTDENGRRRFHGAFTGGFSAGFWNTVGSLEGWTPSTFKSSRSEKAPQRSQQKPEDFMDDEDLGEFGIAPTRIGVKFDYQIDNEENKRKRKLQNPSIPSGPIPGMPVLEEILKPVKDKIAVRILKSMGWKPGQGIGPRLTAKQKKEARKRNKRQAYILKHYGTINESETNLGVKPNNSEEDTSDHDDEDDEDDDDEITFAPDDYEPLVCTPKTDRFGLGYTGLRPKENAEGTSKMEHINLFGPLEVVDKNKKLSITGQAFGVGALEEEDEDIYARDDMSKYDFSLDDKKNTQKKPKKHVQDPHVLEGFQEGEAEPLFPKRFTIKLPEGWKPRNWAERRSRFAPLDPGKAREIEEVMGPPKPLGLGRHDLNPQQRGDILGEKKLPVPQPVEKRSVAELQEAQKLRNERTKSLLELISQKQDNFTRGGIINTKGEEEVVTDKKPVTEEVSKEQEELLKKVDNKTKKLGLKAAPSSDFKPFLGNDAKQERYEKFLKANLKDEMEIASFLSTIQPVELSEWDREMEKKEFIQARKIYQPLGGLMSERFISEATIDAEKSKEPSSKDNKEAKKITMERSKEMWKPHSLLCKRYNIPDPFGKAPEDEGLKSRQKPKLSIFSYLETSVHTKDNFQTPVIIPTHIDKKPQALINNCQTEWDRRFQTQSQCTEWPVTSYQLPSTSTSSTADGDSTISSQSTLHFKLPPKTELEKRIEENRDKPLAEKTELFRAIFDDSDDDEVEKAKVTEQNPKTSSLEIEKLGLPFFMQPKTAAELNVLRNNSPPRGIFAALFSFKNDSDVKQQKQSTIEEASSNNKPKEESPVKPLAASMETGPKITFKSRREREKESMTEATDVYGPALPQNLTAKKDAQNSNNSTATPADERLQDLIKQHKTTTNLDEIWVERSNGDASSDDSESDSSSSTSSQDHSDSKNCHDKHRKKRSKKEKKKSSKKVKKPKKKGKSKKKREEKEKVHKSKKKKKKS